MINLPHNRQYVLELIFSMTEMVELAKAYGLTEKIKSRPTRIGWTGNSLMLIERN